jgi:hypothetical protein
MHRLFGKPKAQAPAPTLEETSTGINARIAECKKYFHIMNNKIRK